MLSLRIKAGKQVDYKVSKPDWFLSALKSVIWFAYAQPDVARTSVQSKDYHGAKYHPTDIKSRGYFILFGLFVPVESNFYLLRKFIR